MIFKPKDVNTTLAWTGAWAQRFVNANRVHSGPRLLLWLLPTKDATNVPKDLLNMLLMLNFFCEDRVAL